MKHNRILLCVVLFLMILNILVPVLYAQQSLSGMSEEERNQKIKDAIQKHREEKEKTGHPKVDPILTDLEDEYKKGSEESAKKFNAGEVLHDENGAVITRLADAEKKGARDAAKKFAKKNGRDIKDGNKITVEITLEPGISGEAFDKTLLEPYGIEAISTSSGNYIWADIPIDKIRNIADEVDGIVFIRAPISIPTPDSYRSEGLSKVGFSNYSAAGIRGSGVKVAVIDVEFGGLNNAISNGDIPSSIAKVDCTPLTGCASTTFSSEWVDNVHGTAVSEIVHDMAPDAQLYLIKTLGGDANPITLKNAVTFCKNNGIKVINHSVAWFNKNFNDGQCFNDNPVCSANDAYNNGILFVKSAGNYGKRHYPATYDDTGTSGWHKTVPSFYAYKGQQVSLYLTWDAWPTTNQNYDLNLFDSFGGVVASSTLPQTGIQAPTEAISWTVDTDGYYYIYVVKQNATANPALSGYKFAYRPPSVGFL